MRRRLLPLLLLVLVAGGAGCSDDASLGDERADQAREAALEAGLDDDVADFLALAARGPVATYQVTFPAPGSGAQLVVANRPPDRRIDVVADGVITEARLVLDGEAFVCPRDEDADAIVDCTRTDAIVEPPGAFGAEGLATLTSALEEGQRDYRFSIETVPIAGVEATCLVTELIEGRDGPELGERGSMCVSQEGAVLRIDQGGTSLEATDYTTDIPDGTFTRPDRRVDE